MNFINSANNIRSPRFQRRSLTNPNRNAIASSSSQQQEVAINPMGHHHQFGNTGRIIASSLKTQHHLSSPKSLRKILQNEAAAVDNLFQNYSTALALLSSASNSQQQYQQNLSVSAPLRTAGGSCAVDNNYYQTTAAAIRSSPSPLLHQQREGQRNNANVERHFDVDRESIDTGIATQLCHPPFHIQQRAIYMCRFNCDGGASGKGYQMEPVIKSRKVIGALDVTQLINDSRCCPQFL